MPTLPRLPFSSVKKPREIETIVTPDGRVLNLIRRYSTTVDENPNDIQKLKSNQRKVQELLDKAVSAYAARHEVDEIAAREQLLAAPVKSADPDAEPTTATPKSFVDYLDSSDRATLAEMNEEILPVPTGVQGAEDPSMLVIKAATMMIKTRAVYAIRTVGNTTAGSEILKVEAIKFPIEADWRFEFGDTVVSVKEYCEEGGDGLISELPIQALKRNLPADRVGLLKNFETGAIEIGFADWDEELTVAHIPGETIRQLYDFYCAEALGMKLADYQAMQSTALLPAAEEPSGKSPKGKGRGKKEEMTLTPSIGENSIGKSNPMDGMTNGSAPTILEAAPSI